MTDARLPEKWLSDRRILRLSDAAFRLHVSGLMWSVSNRTDGVLDDGDLALVPQVDVAGAAELEKSGLWYRNRDTWVIGDYDNTQTSSHELEVLDNLRRREREKKARQRASKGDSPPGQSPGTVPGDSTGQDRQGQDRQGQAPKKDHNVASGCVGSSCGFTPLDRSRGHFCDACPSMPKEPA